MRKPFVSHEAYVADELEDMRSRRADKEEKKVARRALQRNIAEAKRLGRPSVYEPGMDALVYEMRMLGLKVSQIASLIGIGESVLYEWGESHPTFADAWFRGGEGADAEISRAMFHRAKGYSHLAEKIQFDKEGNELRAVYVEHFPPDVSAAEFWLVNRQREHWKRRSSVELSGPDGAPLSPPTVTVTGVVVAPREDGAGG